MLWAATQATQHGLWGQALIDDMQKYNHHVGPKIVGEMMPQERNRVTLAEETNQYGLPIARVTYSYCDNDKRLIDHAISFMTRALQAARAIFGRRWMIPAT